jgi:hypothetical protein
MRKKCYSRLGQLADYGEQRNEFFGPHIMSRNLLTSLDSEGTNDLENV